MRYERVFLIQPDYPGSYYSDYLILPMGLGYVAEALRQAKIQYLVMDMGFGYKQSFLFKGISNFEPHIIGVSMMSSKYKYHYKLIKALKEAFPGIPIVVGGSHVATFKKRVLFECSGIDYGLVGEGEEAIVELCKSRDLTQVKGLLYRSNSDVLYTGDRERRLDLDIIPFPTYEGFEVEKYDNVGMHLFSSRGCPYGCIYCPIKSVIGNQWVSRSSGNVVDEIEYWYNRGYRIFDFRDDAFNIDRKRVFEICDEIERRNMAIELNASYGLRADRADRDLLNKMREAGFKRIAFGVEAGNNKILSNIKKGETVEEIEMAIKNACELNYEVVLFFIIGSPGETEKDIEDSFCLLNKYPVTEAFFYNLTPFPDTELYDWVEKNGYFALPPSEYLNGNMHWSNTPAFFTPELSVKQRKLIYKRGLKISNKLRRAYKFLCYRDGFRKVAVLGNLLAYFLSRNIAQYLLKNSKILKKFSSKAKKMGWYQRTIDRNKRKQVKSCIISNLPPKINSK